MLGKILQWGGKKAKADQCCIKMFYYCGQMKVKIPQQGAPVGHCTHAWCMEDMFCLWLPPHWLNRSLSWFCSGCTQSWIWEWPPLQWALGATTSSLSLLASLSATPQICGNGMKLKLAWSEIPPHLWEQWKQMKAVHVGDHVKPLCTDREGPRP